MVTSPKWIVVLGGGHVSDPSLPANSQINPAALARVVEGVRLYKAIPGASSCYPAEESSIPCRRPK